MWRRRKGKGKRGRGAAWKIPVFRVLKQGRKIYTTPISNAKTAMLLPIIQQMIIPDSIVYTDHFPSCNVLDVSSFHHVRINHSTTFVEGPNHFNGIENFWNQAKRHLRRFNEIRKETFSLYLNECEWRFNGGTNKQLLTQLKSWIKNHARPS